jgi:hypothetical protein
MASVDTLSRDTVPLTAKEYLLKLNFTNVFKKKNKLEPTLLQTFYLSIEIKKGHKNLLGLSL